MRLLLIGFFLAFPVQARVLDVHAEIRVAKSGELTVIERITVEGRNQADALQRELPQAARVADVIRNGHSESYVLDGARLRLGGAPLPEGRHLYQITYRAARRIAFLGDHDALHWSVKGGERVTAEVILPEGVPARQIKVEASGGEYQSFVRDGRAAFRARDGIALVVRFPKGVVAEPGIGQRAHWFFSDYLGALLVLAAVGLSAWVLLQLRRLSASPALLLPAIAAALVGPEECAAQILALRTTSSASAPRRPASTTSSIRGWACATGIPTASASTGCSTPASIAIPHARTRRCSAPRACGRRLSICASAPPSPCSRARPTTG